MEETVSGEREGGSGDERGGRGVKGQMRGREEGNEGEGVGEMKGKRVGEGGKERGGREEGEAITATPCTLSHIKLPTPVTV